MSVAVLAPASATALTTVANVRADLGLAEAAAPEVQIARFIGQASARATSYCRRTFGRETVRERFEGAGCTVADLGGGLLLDRSPVVRVLQVVLDGLIIDPSTYETDERFLYAVRQGDRVPWATRRVVVDYEAGWLLPGEERGDPPTTTAPDLPPDVERAVILLVAASLSNVGRDMMVKSESVDGVGSTDRYVMGASAALPHPEAEAALAEYRRLLFA